MRTLAVATCGGRLASWRLLKYGVRVGAADTERVDASAPRSACQRPRRQAIADAERTCREVNGRVRLLISERGRDLAVLKRQCSFYQTDNPGRSVEVADVRLHRADKAEALLVGRVPECMGEGLHLDRVTDVSSGAMAFNILQCVGRNSCQSLRLDDRFRLPRHTRRQVACFARTVIVDRRGLDHGTNGIL